MEQQTILENIRDDVNTFYIERNVCKSHDIKHIDRCLHMLDIVLENSLLTKDTKFILRLAVILHDVDDEKLCITDNYDNARNILKKYCVEFEDDIIECISYVSSSKNGDTIPTKAINKEYLLYPRFVDRLDALGVNGVIRCYQFTKTKGNPLFTPETSINDDIWSIATEERYKNYKGNSISMIDHYYDKLLRLCSFTTTNPILNRMKHNAIEPLIDIIKVYNLGHLNYEYMENYVLAHS